MVYLFHSISQKAKWERDKNFYPWLKEGEVAADVFNTLRPSDGTLSTYIIDKGKTRLHRVAAALVCTRDGFQHVDYVLIPYATLADAFTLCTTPGKTADDKVNEWHVDIVHLTSEKLARFVQLIRDERHEMDRISEDTVKSMIYYGVENKHIDCDKIKNPKMKAKVCN